MNCSLCHSTSLQTNGTHTSHTLWIIFELNSSQELTGSQSTDLGHINNIKNHAFVGQASLNHAS